MQLFGMMIGLGNPGAEYAMTRHNFGFMLLDVILRYALESGFGSLEKISSPKGKLELWKGWLHPAPALPWLFLKPLTFMNLSGQAVRQVVSYYDIPVQNLLVLHDEMDLPLGRMRFKVGGGSAGHKGVDSMAQELGARDFYRLRLGIGKKGAEGAIRHVIGNFSKTEEAAASVMLGAAAEALTRFQKAGFTATQEAVNGFRLPEDLETQIFGLDGQAHL